MINLTSIHGTDQVMDNTDDGKRSMPTRPATANSAHPRDRQRPSTSISRPQTSSGRRPGTSARPGTARLSIRKENVVKANPAPVIGSKETEFIADGLSIPKLKEICNEEDLTRVTTLKMRVDTRSCSLGRFGTFVPNLETLVLSNSLVSSMRDIGTGLLNLQVINIGRSGVTDLDGIASLPNLRELFAPHNKISSCSAAAMLEKLRLLDLEGNMIADSEQVEYLGLCSELNTLVLRGNPVHKHFNDDEDAYRSFVIGAVPNLAVLDAVGLNEVGNNADGVFESTKHYGTNPQDSARTGSPPRRPQTATARFSADSASKTSAEKLAGTSSSGLTHGSSTLFQGSPLKALLARRGSTSNSINVATNDIPLRSARVPMVTNTVASDRRRPSELDEMLMSVGMEPVDAPPIEQLDNSKPEIQHVFDDLRVWRENFNSVTSQVKDPTTPDMKQKKSIQPPNSAGDVGRASRRTTQRIRLGSVPDLSSVRPRPPSQPRVVVPRPPERPNARSGRRPRTVSGRRFSMGDQTGVDHPELIQRSVRTQPSAPLRDNIFDLTESPTSPTSVT
eukprot:m.110587 g.110587  ORF g.110587 m.110587 type:complete len:562 (-) comp28053_c0_seq2:60-1745(-)